MKTYMIYDNAAERLFNGGRLLKVSDFVQVGQIEREQEGEVIAICDEAHDFVAKALIGRQHKGIAWVFTLVKYDPWSLEFVEEIMQEAIEARCDYFEQTHTNAFRVFNGEGDGIGGVTIDWYASFIQINWYSRGVHQYRDWFIAALTKNLPQLQGIYETKRFELSEGELPIEHTQGELAPTPLIIRENNVHYAIHLGEEWMTGLFLDQHDVRQFVQAQSQGLSMLNLFSYTGGFSVAAAVGGASKTVSVDVANRSLPKTQENFAINHLDSDAHEIRVMDVFDYVDYANRHALQFGLIVCDPPSFARTKASQFRAEKDYTRLAKSVFNLTAVGGMCILSTNHSGYSRQKFIQDLTEVARQHTGTFHLIQTFGLPEDFRTSSDEESHYLKVVVFYREN
ncbi:MAG: class I SAM-dependent rRNA methyltransferase [Aerococcaceae bacterium]|nr:class I SAM-dependent rRNA methyltransferase [Aerococcaceae bacterium]